MFVGNGNVCRICHQLRDIRSKNTYDLDFDLYNWIMSNKNEPMKRPYATSYLLAIAMFALSVTVCEILTVEICKPLTLTFRIEPGSNINMSVERPHATSHVLTIAVFDLSVTVCEIIWTSKMYSIRIFDLGNESSGCWWFRQQFVGHRTLSIKTRAQRLALLGPAVCSRCVIVHFGDTYIHASTTAC